MYYPALCREVTVGFAEYGAAPPKSVTAIFDSDSRWLKVYSAGAIDDSSVSDATVWNYISYIKPSSFFYDGIAPTALTAKIVTASLPVSLLPPNTRITAVMPIIGAPVVSIPAAPDSFVTVDGFESLSIGDSNTRWLNFLVKPDGVFYDGIASRQSLNTYVTARFGDYEPVIYSTYISVQLTVTGSPTIKRYYAPSVQYSTPYGFNSQSFGGVGVISDRFLSVKSINEMAFGLSELVSSRSIVSPPSWLSSRVGSNTRALNFNKTLSPNGVAASNAFGKPSIYNLKQFVLPTTRYDQSSYGVAYLQGGVKYLLPRSYDASVIGKVDVTNTTANQRVAPKGIARSVVVPSPIVSPYMIYAGGIYSTVFGSVNVIPTPVLRHKGVNHFEAGKNTVWYHTRPLGVSGFESYATGYPDVFDPAQFVQQKPINRTAVFGDTYAKNVWELIKAAGAIDSQAVSEWATLENKNRQYLAKGFLSQSFGTQLIKNKSPSIFFNGLPAPIFYNQAIGYRIRKVAPTGFDRLGLGKPDVIKTPELKPNGLVATQFGTQWASNYVRGIEHYSKDHSVIGKPTVWFRYRYAYPTSWQSSKFSSSATVTHGVREVIAQGFIQQGYGNTWVSAGVRLIGPTAIYKEYPSNHYIGRHQEIKPVGYIATLFGTRIIPKIQAVYPLGFDGVFGLATAYLQTQHLKPIGYFSTGEKAFRWGRQIVYNLTQYVTQNYDGGNGLVPPKWPDWTAIENRNKVIGAIGTAMQRFGYAQIDNNARLLEPQGLIATRFDKSMVAYRIRYLPLQGIEQPYMSDWLVVYNAARVIRPSGSIQTLIGNAEAVKTRRYFDRIGRIESFESGTAMIAYRIRHLEIEKRYSIEPPIIRLPSVGLYTRYIGFNGYETAKYGLPSLSIHFNIIGPSWNHRDDFGYGAVRNATPELQVGAFDSQEFGNAGARTQWRTIAAQGDTATLFGGTSIADRRKNITIPGWQDSKTSQLHTVIRTGAPPYTPQNIWLQNESNPSANGFGIEPSSEPSRPGLNQNVLYHHGHNSQKFGGTFVWSNNLYIDVGIPLQSMDAGPVVTNKKREITPIGIDAEIKISQLHRVTPSYIKQHHDQYSTAAGERFGWQVVTNQHRSIRPYGYQIYQGVSQPGVELGTRYINPSAIRQFLFGVPELPFTPKTIFPYGELTELYGKAIVSRPPYTGPQTVSVIGLSSASINRPVIDLFNRYIGVNGHNSQSMGRSLLGDTPYMWQGLRIGAFVPMNIGAGDTSLFGEVVIGLRVREIPLEGFVAFRGEYDYTNFNARIKVTGTITDYIASQDIKVSGFDSEVTGTVEARFGQQFIRPDGNSNQFRKGGYDA